MNIDFVSDLNHVGLNEISIVVDALFGFSYKPPCRPEFHGILKQISDLDGTKQKLVSIDIPSGWNVESGPPGSPEDNTPTLRPDCLVSLTAPKQCASFFGGTFHWLGGRFVPPALAAKYSLDLPEYEAAEQCLLLK